MMTQKIKTKRIMLMATADWSMRLGMKAFVDFLDPVIKFGRHKFKLELGRIIAVPLLCGEHLAPLGDLVVDRTIHWNPYYKAWAQQAINSQMRMVNHSNTFANHDKHSTYDLLARCMHPKDRMPVTVLLPQYAPYSPDLEEQEMWEYRQELIAQNTRFGWDESRRSTDWKTVDEKYDRAVKMQPMAKMVREHFYYMGNYLQEAVDEYFGGRFPIYLKKARGGGGSDVYKIKSMEELYQKYDRTGGQVFHLQEAIEDYDLFIRCMSIGPQILPMKFQPDEPQHQHYGTEKLEMDRDIYHRLSNYSLFIDAYHRWTYNSFEAIIKHGQIFPIDYANACPDSNFTSLHVHFPWLICALVKWFAYCAVTEKDMRIDMEQNRYLDVINDPKKTPLQKFEHYCQLSEEYFEVDRFREFCEENFKHMEEKMIEFYDRYFDQVIDYSIEMSDFPPEEKGNFHKYYLEMMTNIFRPNADRYLQTVIYAK